MAAIDPVLTRAVRLLLSNDEDAADQLRAMLDEALRNKYGVGVRLPGRYSTEDHQVSTNKEQSPFSPSKYHVPSPTLHSEESNEFLPEPEDSFSMNLDLLQEDLTCVVCGLLNVGARNQLVECNDCHNLYHQDCHKPAILEIQEVGSSWHCSDCIKKNETMASPKALKSSPRSIPHVSGGKPAFLTSSSSSHIGSSSHKSSSSKSGASHKSSKQTSGSSSSSHSEHKRHSSSSSSSSSHKSSHHKSRHSR